MAFDEFEVNGNTYRSDKLNVFDQGFIVQKLVPLAVSFLPVAQAAMRNSGGGTPAIAAILQIDINSVMPLAAGISSLPEADVRDIYARCLSHVQRGSKSPAGVAWAPIWSSQAGALMFDDIDLDAMLTIVIHVIKRDILPFIVARLSRSIGGSATI